MAEWQRAFDDEQYTAEYQEEAVVRAKRRLAEIASGEVPLRPAGVYLVPVVLALVFLFLPAAGLAALAVGLALEPGQEPIMPAIPGATAFVLLVLVVLIIRGARPRSPKRALKIFYSAAGRGSRHAQRLVVPNDLADDFPRYYPDVPGLGPHGRPPYRFDEATGFKDYWNGLLRYHTAPYCLARVSSLSVREPRPGVLIADYQLQLLMNTQLWWIFFLLGCPGLLIAAVIDAATRKTVTAPLRKILVRVGEEYHLLDGSWQGPEEEWTKWLEEPAE